MSNFSDITSSPFLSGYTYRTIASMGIPDKNDTPFMKKVCNGIDSTKVKEGDILYVTGVECKNFFKNIAPKIECNFSVISAMWDEGAHQEFENLLPENLDTWWTINKHIRHPKVKSIPLGLQNLHWGWRDNPQSSPKVIEKIQRTKKIVSNNILCSFSVRNNPQHRSECAKVGNALGATLRGFTNQERKSDKYVNEYFNQVSIHRFNLCPWGAGVDTHRLWETLYLGAIPITLKHPAYEEFYDYPVIFLDSWKDLLDIDLDEKYNKLMDKLFTEKRIFFNYWLEKINE